MVVVAVQIGGCNSLVVTALVELVVVVVGVDFFSNGIHEDSGKVASHMGGIGGNCLGVEEAPVQRGRFFIAFRAPEPGGRRWWRRSINSGESDNDGCIVASAGTASGAFAVCKGQVFCSFWWIQKTCPFQTARAPLAVPATATTKPLLSLSPLLMLLLPPGSGALNAMKTSPPNRSFNTKTVPPIPPT